MCVWTLSSLLFTMYGSEDAEEKTKETGEGEAGALPSPRQPPVRRGSESREIYGPDVSHGGVEMSLSLF